MDHHNVKEENLSFSDHDYVQNGLDNINLDNVFIDVENVQNENVTARRTIKRPRILTMENQTKKRKAPKSGNGGKKNKKEVPLQFEVDYIFGKRADKFCKGKVEYRVFWKGYAISDASWEPEDNLRHCNEAIEKYERSQGLVQTKASKLEKDGKLEDLEKDSKQEGTSNNKSNGKKKGRKGKKRGNSVGLDKKNWTKKAKIGRTSKSKILIGYKEKGKQY